MRKADMTGWCVIIISTRVEWPDPGTFAATRKGAIQKWKDEMAHYWNEEEAETRWRENLKAGNHRVARVRLSIEDTTHDQP